MTPTGVYQFQVGPSDFTLFKTVMKATFIYMSCHQGLRKDPMVTLNIRCLQRGGGVALIQTNNNNFLNRRGSGGAWAVMTQTG